MCDVYEMAMGVSSKAAAPIHTDILLTLMLELLPYENSDKSEFSEERFHGFLSALNDEIIEEEKRRKEPPDPESANHILLQIQQTVGQMAGQMKELQSSVTEISRKVQRHDEILNSRGATDQSRVRDLAFLKGDELRSSGVEVFPGFDNTWR